MSHTPGPWTASEPNDSTDITIAGPYKKGKRGGKVADLVAMVSCGLSSTQTANAHLIALAPELLIRLKETLRALESHIESDSRRTNISREGICPCTLNEVKRAKELLAKLESR